MKKTLFAAKATALVIAIALLITLLCLPAATQAEEPVAPDLTGVTAFVWDGDSVTVTAGSDANYDVVVITAAGDKLPPAAETDTSGAVTYSVPAESDGELQIAVKKAGGSYVFSGEGTGSIAVKKQATADAVLYLNGLTLRSDLTALIAVGKDSSAACIIHAVAGTVNTLTDSALNNDETNPDNAVAENAVIKGKAGSNVTVTGGGTLTINANGKNGIKANHLLTIEGDVTLTIDAPDKAISGENTIVINGGTISVTTHEGDGIKAAADDAPIGSIVINDGSVTVDSYGDGIQATASVTINGGSIKVTAYGGYDAVYDKDDDTYPSAKGIKASGSYTVTDAETGVETEVDATDCTLLITGGTFDLNTADDGIHSDGTVTITGGTFVINTGDDGIHAEYETVMGVQGNDDSLLTVEIQNSNEGIEGAGVTLNSGTYTVYSADDAINAANGDLTGYAYAITINGGSYYCAASNGDCLDSNGDLNLLGGTIVVLGSAATQGESNTALDCDGTLTITGATVLAVGNSDMAAVPAGNSQAYVTWTAAGDATASAAGGMNPGGQPGGTPFGGGQQPPELPSEGQAGMPQSGGGQQPPELPSEGQARMPQSGGGQQPPELPSEGQAGMPQTGGGQQPPELPSEGQAGMPQFGGQFGGRSGFITQGTTLTITDSDGNTLFTQTANWNTQNTGSVGYVLFSDPDLTAGSTYTLTVDNAVQPTQPQKLPENPGEQSGEQSGEEPGEQPGETPADPDVKPTDPGETPAREEPAPGDVNNDGKADASDALMALKAAVGKITLSEQEKTVADANGDGKVDASDALAILKIAVGK